MPTETTAEADAATAPETVTITDDQHDASISADSGARGAYRRALSIRDLRLLLSALTVSAIGGWAYNVALVVVVFERTHSASWVAAASAGRFVPALLFSTYAGVIAERFERHRVMVTCDVLCAAYMVGMAVTAAVKGPVLLIIVFAAFTSVTAICYPSASAAMIPQVVGERDLAAANAINAGIDNLAVLVGPAVGGVLLLWFAPDAVMLVNAGTFVVSALLVLRVRARSVPSDVTHDGGPLQQMLVGIKAIGSSSTAAILVGFSVLASFLYGTDTVLFVFVSRDKLGTGPEGYGYLLAALGVGGLLAAALVNRLSASRRLGLVIAVSMILYCAPTALLTVVHTPSVAFVIQVVRGAGTLIVDTLALTALQRSLPSNMIARVFGVFWALILGAINLGAIAMPPILGAVGLNATLLLVGLVIPGLVVVTYPKLAVLDRDTRAQVDDLQPRIVALEKLGILAAASRPALEQLARSATEVVISDTGTSIVTEGEPADALYVLLDGEVEVKARGEGKRRRRIRTLSAPAYFGEIGVLEQIPRTASVLALTPCRLLRIDGDDFLTALSECAPSGAFVAGLSGRLARTHPSRRIASIPTSRDGK
jgi:predicted MFS family arabinose efflux permease